MPTLDWIGKQTVVNHHKTIPFHLLKANPGLSVGDPNSGNLIVQGDNLLGLPVKELAESRGITAGSFRMRLGNFAAVYGNGGLGHFGRIIDQVYKQYKNTDKVTLRRLAFPKNSK